MAGPESSGDLADSALNDHDNLVRLHLKPPLGDALAKLTAR